MTVTAANPVDPSPKETVSPPRRVAVVDIGTTSIRMSIGEIRGKNQVRTIEALYQAVDLGKDTFSTGAVKSSTIEDCVRILKGYKVILEQYQITDPDRIRVVATSAVHEATNQLQLIDRLYIATGIRVEPLDDAEVNRFAYLAIQPLLANEPKLKSIRTLIVEVGGGNTEVLLLQRGDVVFAQTFRLGSLRLRQTLHAQDAPTVQVRGMMESQIHRTVEQVRQQVAGDEPLQIVALGGDIRFAASQLLEWNPDELGTLPVAKLAQLTEKVLAMTTDDIVRKYHLAFPDAATLGPALLAYLGLAREFNLQEIRVTNVNFRDGLLKEMAFLGTWSESFSDQIIRSAMNLGRRYKFDKAHGLHTGKLSRTLFHALKKEHGLGPRYELILYVAALLHDIGNFVSNRSHHKHSMYLILHGDLFGLSRHEILLTALIARYHRRASPKPMHEGYASLSVEDRITVAKLAAILRVADALDRSDRQRIDAIQCAQTKDRFVISVDRVEDISLEQLALEQKGRLFEEVYGLPILLRKVILQ